ncbi:uncharacterized protein PV09_09046 [Verruconis gallopava]|uniref:SWR1-complex protein 4 n=1 Tax=Verruconis gallopava TaxID=253628 RepID=A0A0D2AJZ5_9PEZI|nr:uncharacterized protein PV09_09046 [Verruconis gallopava]KIV99278.1 hypothetical protein PV09_09046 [Verruconis gallopava]
MASSRDVKDIMGLAAQNGAAPAAAPAPKKPKPVATKRLTGINREVLALHGDRAPPVSILDSTKTFRAKLKRDFKPAHWEFAPFTNEARTDGLRLRHWKRHKPNKAPAAAAAPDAGPDAMDIENKDPDASEPYRFAKYNVDISVPQYDDEKYEAHLKSDDWSREETDYLIGLVKEYAQKWPIIIDRYEWPPGASSDDATALARPQDARTLESLKARYYQVWAKCLALEHGGESGMNETEFALYETLTKYRPDLELQRKELGWRLFERPLEEIREEEYLLAELQRIMISAQKFEAERAEVRQRLDHPTSRPGNVPSTFAELNQLYNQLFAQDRNRRARGRLSMNTNELATPGGLTNGTNASTTHHREPAQNTTQVKKGGTSASQPVRQLDARAEKKYGITTHDRLTSGVTFRSDKLLKMRQAKSQIQTQKITAALVELGVPDVLQLPTQRVMDAFETLIQKIQKLVDARKVLEKEEAEARVQGGLRKELQKEKTEGEAGTEVKREEEPPRAEEEDDEEDEEEAKGAGEEEGDDEDEDEKDAEGEDEEGEGSQFDGNEPEEEEDGDADADADGDEMEVD